MLNTLVFGTTFHYGVIEQYAFSLVLFCICFVFYSFLATSGFSQSTITTTQPSDAERIDIFVKEVSLALQTEPDNNSHPKNLPTTPLVTAENDNSFLKLPTTNKEINDFVTSLKLRDARKVAKSLSIKQKVNGKDKALAQFKREIRQALRKNDRLLEHAKSAIAA